MKFANSLRVSQRKREEAFHKEAFDLFSEHLASKNPLNSNSKIQSSSVWEKELGPFFAQNMKDIPAAIKNDIDGKFRQLGLDLEDKCQKDTYKKLILSFLHSDLKALVFIVLKTMLDLCLLNKDENDNITYQFVADKISNVIFQRLNALSEYKASQSTKKKTKTSEFFVSIGLNYDNMQKDLLHVASYFMDVVLSNQNVLVLLEREGGRDTYNLGFGDGFAYFYNPEMAKGLLFKQTKAPMVCQPDPWNLMLSGGGYLLKEDRAFLVNCKTSIHRHRVLEDFKNAGSKKIFRKAVNLLQQTPWRINEELLSVVKHFHNNASDVNDPSRRLLYGQTIKMATDLKNAIFYLPWYLDFRGRMYPSVLQVSPQSHDGGRALLNFAEPQEITRSNEDHTLENLAIFGYSKYKPSLGKLSRNGMVDWVESVQGEIEKCAKDPITNCEFWQNASDRYSFLAFCLEWSRIKESSAHSRYTSIPVYIDGTCNGFQHYAALLRDHISAPLVNLVDNDIPGDFYQNVVDKLRLWVSAEDYSDSCVKKLVLGFVDRKFVKKSIISAGYGAGADKRSLITFKNFRDALKSKGMDDEYPEFVFPSNTKVKVDEHPLYKKTLIIEKQISKIIKDICPSFSQAKGWLNRVAQAIYKEKECLCWFNPAGMPVYNFYYNYPFYTIRLFLNGKSQNFKFKDFDSKKGLIVAVKDSILGVAPNYIHSLDSGHAAMVIDRFAENLGKDSSCGIAAVHDSFAANATNIDLLHKIVRETFCEIHADNQLAVFKEQIEEQVAVTLPDLPKLGELDLQNVLKSKYFFG